MNPPGGPAGGSRSAPPDAREATPPAAARPASVADLGGGFADRVHGPQQVFRAVLEAMSRPGRLQTLPARALQGLDPGPDGRGLAALLLTLLDGATCAWLAPSGPAGVSADFLRFHTGVRFAADPADAAFVVLPAGRADASWWSTLRMGSDEAPQEGATLVVSVPALSTPPAGTPALVCTGPGIATSQALAVGGIAPDFWRARESQASQLPRGIDLILVCGDTLAALPRTTRLEGIA